MENKPKWLTLPFWTAIVTAVLMVVVALGLLGEEESGALGDLVISLIAAALPIAALILGYGQARSRSVAMGLLSEDTKPWLTAEFWLAIAHTVVMVLVAARLISQEQADTWEALLGPFVSAAVALAAYVYSKLAVTTEHRAFLFSGRAAIKG